MYIERWRNESDRGKSNQASATFLFPHIAYGLNGQELEPGLRDDSPTTNPLSHGRILIGFMYVNINSMT